MSQLAEIGFLVNNICLIKRNCCCSPYLESFILHLQKMRMCLKRNQTRCFWKAYFTCVLCYITTRPLKYWYTIKVVDIDWSITGNDKKNVCGWNFPWLTEVIWVLTRVCVSIAALSVKHFFTPRCGPQHFRRGHGECWKTYAGSMQQQPRDGGDHVSGRRWNCRGAQHQLQFSSVQQQSPPHRVSWYFYSHTCPLAKVKHSLLSHMVVS